MLNSFSYAIHELRYHTLTGRTIDLSQLTPSERSLLRSTLAEYRRQPPWNEFSSFWRSRFREMRLDLRNSVAYPICEDIEARLGIAQDRMAPPDYRDVLIDLITERFASRNAFCESTGIDRGHLSRVLAGRADLSLSVLHDVLDAAGLVLWARPKETLAADLAQDAERLSSLLGTDNNEASTAKCTSR